MMEMIGLTQDKTKSLIPFHHFTQNSKVMYMHDTVFFLYGINAGKCNFNRKSTNRVHANKPITGVFTKKMSRR